GLMVPPGGLGTGRSGSLPGLPMRIRAAWVEAELWQHLTLIRLGGFGEPFANAGELTAAMGRWEAGRANVRRPSGAEATRRRTAGRGGVVAASAAGEVS